MAKNDKNKTSNSKKNTSKNKSTKKSYNVDEYLKLTKKDQKEYLKGLTTANRKKLEKEAKKKQEQDKKNQEKQSANAKISAAEDANKYSLEGISSTIGSIIDVDDAMHGIEGIPYQFSPVVDPRPGKAKIGRKYMEKIYSRMPLVFLAPCDRIFMDEHSKEDRSTIISFLMNNTENFSEDLLNEKGRYFNVKYSYTEYYQYLNPMMVAMASFLNIGDREIKVGNGQRTRINKIDWSNEANDDFESYFSSKENLIFYANELNNISETFGNDTMESSLASTVNGFSDQAKELRFLINGGVAGTLMENAKNATSSITESLSNITSTLGGGLVGSVTKNGLNTIVNGGKIIFPKMWSDSSHNTSYSINFKFRSPDNDTLSIYLNILKPYAKLLALVMPKMSEANDKYDPNGYESPYLVRATSPGFFHIDMGLITSMSVSKGEEGQWNDDGLPTVLDVSIEIEDLYNSILSMTGYKSTSQLLSVINPVNVITDPLKFISNTAYVDFLANTCGVNIHKPTLERMANLISNLMDNELNTIPSRAGSFFDQAVTNVIGKAWRKIGF